MLRLNQSCFTWGGAYRRDAKTRGTREEGNGVEGAVPLISGVSGICSPRPRGMAPSSLGTFGGFFSGVAELVSAKQAGVVPPGERHVGDPEWP
jgi:hypothetical protein